MLYIYKCIYGLYHEYSMNMTRLISYTTPQETGCAEPAQQVGWENQHRDLNRQAEGKEINLMSLFA